MDSAEWGGGEGWGVLEVELVGGVHHGIAFPHTEDHGLLASWLDD